MMVILGVITSITQTSTVCDQFPLCFSSDGFRIEILLVNLHRILTLLTGIILLSAFNFTWRYYREKLSMMIPITISFSIFMGQSLVGAIQIFRNFDLNLLFIHSISSLVYLMSIIFIYRNSAFEEEPKDEYKLTFFNDSLRRKDYLVLNKPIIVALLLVTTYAGMVVGGEKIPSFSLTIWTMLGGALAAGGASAINQFIDRKIDLSMQRTAKRPLPAGRLYPAEALALGVAEIVFSFYIFTAFVNLNAAILAMVGMVYYVIIYSKWLKHATVQNIVIGGGAGAIPPLVGWAAATGGLNVPSIFLFALVFLWTPPHFWALALIRKNDYARANVPMLPVIMGEEKTRFQILVYTIQLVLLTLLMPLFGVGGGVYFVLAFVLGLWLLSTAWQVYKKSGNKIAFKMYRYSSMYLAFIFLALVIDVLVL
jgi:protoheme IX farnesyltransferase